MPVPADILDDLVSPAPAVDPGPAPTIAPDALDDLVAPSRRVSTLGLPDRGASDRRVVGPGDDPLAGLGQMNPAALGLGIGLQHISNGVAGAGREIEELTGLDSYDRESGRQQPQGEAAHDLERQEAANRNPVGKAVAFGVGSLPWIVAPPVGAGLQAGEGYGEARDAGHSKAASAAIGAGEGAVGLLVPGPVGKLVGDAVAPAAGRLVGKAAGDLAGRTVGGAAGGAAMNVGNAGVHGAAALGDVAAGDRAMAATDAGNAVGELRSIPAAAGTLGLAALVHGGLDLAAQGRAISPHALDDLVEPTNAGRGRTGVVDAPVAARDAAPPAVAGEAPAAPSGMAPADAVVAPSDAHAPAERPAVGGTVPAEPGAPQPATASAPVAPTILDDLVSPTRTPVAEGRPLDSIESLRNRAAANARGELGQPKPSADTLTPITGSPVLPEGTDHGPREQAPAAAAHVQGTPGESAAPAREGGAVEEAGRVREQAPAQAEEARPVLEPKAVQQPVLITKRMENELRGLGYGEDALRKMTPVEANDILENGRMAPRPGAAPAVNRSHDVPLFGGTSEDGRTVYIDRNAPRTVDVNGKPADVDKYTAIHERAEKPLLDQGMSYADAHDHANAVENAALRADGHDPAAYNAALKEHIDAAAAKPEPRVPPDIERKPYTESGVALPPKGTSDAAPRESQSAATAPAPVADERAAATPADVAASSNEAPAAKRAAVGADQRATSTRPDLAIPSQEPAAREATKEADRQRTLAGEPEPRSRASQREAAAERVAADAGGEVARLRKHVEGGGALSEQDAQILHIAAEQHARAGDSDEAMRTMMLYRRGKAEAARSVGSGADPLESAPQRAQRMASEAMLEPDTRTAAAMDAALSRGDHAEYQRLLDQHAGRIKALEAEVKRLTGLDPHNLKEEAEKPPAPKRSAKEKVAKASVEVRREFGDLLKQLKDSLRKPTSTGAFGGEQADLIAKIIANRIKAGLLKAADVALDIAKALPRLKRDPEMQGAFTSAWEKQTGEKVDPASIFTPAEPKPAKPPPTLDEQVQSAQDKLNAAIERHHAAMGQTPAERLSAIEAKAKVRQDAKDALHPEVSTLLDQRKALDSEVRKRDAIIQRNAARVIDAVATAKADAWDKVYEYRRNAVHTSLRLPLKKIASDAASLLHHALTDWVGRPLANLAPGGADTASFGDIPHVVRGILPGLARGWRNALETWATNRNAWQEQIGAARALHAQEAGEALSGHTEEFHQRAALTGIVGKAVGWNIRAVGAFQAFAETLMAHMQVGAEAYRRAYDPTTGERLTGQALEDHMHEQVSDLASPSWTQADTVAKDITGVTPHQHGPIAWLNKLASLDVAAGKNTADRAWRRLGKEMARHTALFRTLPFNFLVKGIYHMTPLNGLSILARGAKSLTGLALRKGEWSYQRSQFNTDIAKHALGWASALTLASLMDDDKGQPRITGYGWKPTDSDVPAPPEHSVRINGEWHDYAGLGAAAHAIGTMVDALRGVRSVQKGKPIGAAAKDFAKTFGSHVVNETYLRSVRDVAQVAESEDKAAKFVGTFASSFYPTMFKDAGRATEATVADRRVKEDGFWSRTAQVAKQQLDIPGVQMTPSVDLFGKDVAKDDLSGPVTSWGIRTLNPFSGPPDVRDTDADPYRKMIVKWNEDHPNDQLMPKAPEPKLRIGKRTVALTPQQYHDFCADAGARTMTLLGRMTLNTDAPTERDAKMLENAVKSGQEGARGAMKMRVMREAKPSD